MSLLLFEAGIFEGVFLDQYDLSFGHLFEYIYFL